MTPTPGVNLAGYFTAELGIGEMGRLVVAATEESGLPFVTRTYDRTRSRQGHPFVDRTGPLHEVTVAAVTAAAFAAWVRDVPDLVEGRHVIGIWPWEVTRFRQFPRAFRLVDEVWAISEFNRAAVEARTDRPVHVLPLPTAVPDGPEPLDRERLGLPESRPYFFFAYDHLSKLQRKNPLGLVAAFVRAFPRADGPLLVLKSVNSDLMPTDGALVRAAVAERPDIVLMEDYLPAADVAALMAHCLAYVSLHRSEGYGQTLAEAMVRGRPVIATGYSGNVDFMDDTTSLLVPCTEVKVGRGQLPYPRGATWADPDLDAAASHLRWVASDPEAAADLGARGREHHLRERTIGRTAAFIRERIEAAYASRGPDRV